MDAVIQISVRPAQLASLSFRYPSCNPLSWISSGSQSSTQHPFTVKTFLRSRELKKDKFAGSGHRNPRSIELDKRRRRILEGAGRVCSCKLESHPSRVNLAEQVSSAGSRFPFTADSEERKSASHPWHCTHLEPVEGLSGAGSTPPEIVCQRSDTAAGVRLDSPVGKAGEIVVANLRGLNEGFFRGGRKFYQQSALLVAPVVAGLNLKGPQSVLQALGVLATIITVHEAGHFIAARLQNIHVSQFAIGFGPTLAKFHHKGVDYSIGAIPLGGFVGFPDEPDHPDLLKNRSLLERSLVISAGVLANIVFAYSILFVQVFSVGLLEQEYSPGVVVPDVIDNSAAARGGIKAGDVVLSVNGYTLSGKDASVFDLVDFIKGNPNKRVAFFLQRGPEVVGVHVIPDVGSDGSGKIGVQLSPNGKPHRVKASNLVEAIVLSSQEFSRLTVTVVENLKQVIFNFGHIADRLAGPVGIVAVGAQAARSDVTGLFRFAAVININLAVVNILPLPALDGGYLALMALEALRGGKKLPNSIEQSIMSSGFLLFLALGVVLMVRDTINLGFVQQIM